MIKWDVGICAGVSGGTWNKKLHKIEYLTYPSLRIKPQEVVKRKFVQRIEIKVGSSLSLIIFCRLVRFPTLGDPLLFSRLGAFFFLLG
jgi:hypothetical protein